MRTHEKFSKKKQNKLIFWNKLKKMPGIEIQKIMTGISISERTERGKMRVYTHKVTN